MTILLRWEFFELFGSLATVERESAPSGFMSQAFDTQGQGIPAVPYADKRLCQQASFQASYPPFRVKWPGLKENSSALIVFDVVEAVEAVERHFAEKNRQIRTSFSVFNWCRMSK